MEDDEGTRGRVRQVPEASLRENATRHPARVLTGSRQNPMLFLTAEQPLVVLDGVVSDEKLAALLALQAEYPESDFKETLRPARDRR